MPTSWLSRGLPWPSGAPGTCTTWLQVPPGKARSVLSTQISPVSPQETPAEGLRGCLGHHTRERALWREADAVQGAGGGQGVQTHAHGGSGPRAALAATSLGSYTRAPLGLNNLPPFPEEDPGCPVRIILLSIL